jgi:hypothetical protein
MASNNLTIFLSKSSKIHYEKKSRKPIPYGEYDVVVMTVLGVVVIVWAVKFD